MPRLPRLADLTWTSVLVHAVPAALRTAARKRRKNYEPPCWKILSYQPGLPVTPILLTRVTSTFEPIVPILTKDSIVMAFCRVCCDPLSPTLR